MPNSPAIIRTIKTTNIMPKIDPPDNPFGLAVWAKTVVILIVVSEVDGDSVEVVVGVGVVLAEYVVVVVVWDVCLVGDVGWLVIIVRIVVDGVVSWVAAR